MRQRSVAQNRWVLGTTLLLFLGPALLDILSSWRLRPFGWVAADAFYYLTVARNIARYGHVAYDRVHPSNGFHPLWQAVVAVGALITERGLVLAVVLLGLALLSGAIMLLALAWRRADGTLSLWFPLLPIGAYGWIVSPMWIRCMSNPGIQNAHEGPMPLYGTLWSYANGMESALVIFFLAWAARLYVKGAFRESPKAGAGYGLVLSAIVLSRLDHFLLLLPLVSTLAVTALASRRRRPILGSALVAFVLPIVAYLILNRISVGTYLPTSGTAKTIAPSFSNDVSASIKQLLEHPGGGLFLARAYRVAQIVVPSLAAIAYLATCIAVRPARTGIEIRVRPWLRPCDVFTVQLAPGVLLLAAYNLLFVPLDNQGHWYFPASVLFTSLAAMAILDPVERYLVAWCTRPRLRRVLGGAWVVAAGALSVLAFVRLHRQPAYHLEYARFYWKEAPAIIAHYKGNLPRFFEHDDGIIAWSLGSPTMNNALGLDPMAWVAASNHRLLTLAVERGYDRLTSLVYVRTGLKNNGSAAEARDYARSVIGGDDVAAFDFAVDYASEDMRFAIVRARRK